MTPKSTVSEDSSMILSAILCLASAAAFTSNKVSMLLKLNPAINFCAVRLLKSTATSGGIVKSLMLGNEGATDDVDGVDSDLSLDLNFGIDGGDELSS